MYLPIDYVKSKVAEAIREKKIIDITYFTKGNPLKKFKRKAPFDLGTTNMRYYEKNKNQLYMFCFDHEDKKTGIIVPQVHGHDATLIEDIIITEEYFDPVELTKIHLLNTHYDYRTCRFALEPYRNWYN